MIVTCNRILFPTVIEEEDDIIREAKMKTAGKNIRKRKITFSLEDIEKFSEHEDTRFILVWFYYSEPVVIEYDYRILEEQFRIMHEKEEDESYGFWIPAN
jgi:hypothetical protein